MSDRFTLDIGQGIRSSTDNWYKNVQLLGSGGNSVTFLVHSTSGDYTGGLFALKVFRRLSAPERRIKFKEEIEFLKGVDHPSIMRVYDEGEFEVGSDLFPFVVAEYLPTTLHELIYKTKGLL